jgi:hypothetical protein
MRRHDCTDCMQTIIEDKQNNCKYMYCEKCAQFYKMVSKDELILLTIDDYDDIPENIRLTMAYLMNFFKLQNQANKKTNP